MLTNGYDYVFSLSSDEVNSILTENLTNKNIEVKYNTKDPDSGSTITLNFSLFPWQIVPGGSGTLLNMSLPIKAGYMAIEGGALPSGSYDLTNVSVIIQIMLGWLGTGDKQQASGSGGTNHLVFSPTTTTKNNPGYISEVAIIDPDKQLNLIAKGILSSVVLNSLIANKDKLKYIFANVELSPANLSSWLTPVKWQYYYVGSKTGPSALCFLCQLSNKSFPPQPTFDAKNLDINNNSLVLISQESFFNNVILPSVEKSFPTGKFTSSTNPEEAVTIKNNGDFNLDKVTTNSFTLTTSNSGNGLAISSSGGGSLKFLFGLAKLPGASYSWSVSSVNPLSYSNNLVSFNKDNSPTIHHDQTIHWYDWVLLVGLGITNIAGLVSAILDSVNDYYDKSADMGVTNINNRIQGSIDGDVINLKNLISWDKQERGFSPTDAGLSVSFYVRGNLMAS